MDVDDDESARGGEGSVRSWPLDGRRNAALTLLSMSDVASSDRASSISSHSTEHEHTGRRDMNTYTAAHRFI